VDHLVQIVWAADGTVSASPDPVIVENSDTLAFQSTNGPVNIRLTPQMPAPAVFSSAEYKAGDPPIVVQTKGYAHFDCGGPGRGGGVKPGSGGGVGH